MLKKKLLNIFLNFFFYLKAQSFWLIMENNFNQMAASVGYAATKYFLKFLFLFQSTILSVNNGK